MEDRKLTEKESLELITDMIRNTRDRLHIGDGNMLLISGYGTAVAAVIQYILMLITGDPRSNLVWLVIPLIIMPLIKREKRKHKSVTAPTTYVDKISNGIWKLVGTVALAGCALCTGFMIYGYNCWLLMFIYALVVVGFGTTVQGIVIREKSLVAGGMFSIIAGGFITCCVICKIPVLVIWAIPLLIVSFVLMTIIPGHIINNKAHKICQEN